MYRPMKDLTGQKFGKLTAIKPVRKNKTGNYIWLCQCDCGNYKEVAECNLHSGNVKSCGCIRKRKYSKRLFHIYHNIKARCLNKNSLSYKNYGGRGILMCNEWLKGYHFFAQWAIENGYKDNLTIDRINVNGNYEPSNCQWIPLVEQSKNRRTNHYITFNGKTKTISDWSKEIGIERKLLYYYLNKNLTLGEVIKLKCKKTY